MRNIRIIGVLVVSMEGSLPVTRYPLPVAFGNYFQTYSEKSLATRGKGIPGTA